MLLINPVINAQISEQWSSRFNGHGDYSDKANCITSDNSGNIYIAGYSVNIGENRDFMTARLNSSGDTLWKRTFSGKDNGPDEVTAMVTDNSGNIIVTGFVDDKGNDILTIKYNPSGDTLWTRKYDYIGEDEQANSVAVDASDNIYITGQSDSDPSGTTNDDIITIKYNPAGAEQWVMRYNGSGNGNDRASDIIVVSGNVYLTGRTDNGADDDFITIKYTSAGVQQWLKTNDGGAGNDRAVAMISDASGNIILTGRSDNGNDDDYLTVKYNAAGSELWSMVFDGAGAGNDRPAAIAVDGSGNVFVCGQSDGDPTALKNYDFVTVKYSSSGTEQWNKAYNGSGNGEDIPIAICVDNSGNVFVAGESDTDPSATAVNIDYATVKYNSSGVLQWSKTLNGSYNSDDKATAMLVNSSGNILVTGGSINNITMKDAVTVQYDNSGNVIWSKTLSGVGDNSDNSNAITTDAAGNIYIAGYSVNTDTDRDMCTMKLNSAGDTLWISTYNGTSNFTDEATAIALDPAGYVYVTGYTKNSGASYDFTTIKYAINTGDTIWVRKYNSPYGESDKAWSIALDAAGNVYLTGQSDGDVSSVSNYDFCTVKYNSSGTLQWVNRYNGTANNDDIAHKIYVAQSGNIYVAGSSSNGTDDDYLTLQYSSTGSQLWANTFNSTYGNDQLAEMFVDANENIYVTGSSKNNDGLTEDYLTVKYNSTGLQQWAARYNGTTNSDDHAKDVTADAFGNVYVTGESVADTLLGVKNYNYLTIKYDLPGNEIWARDFEGVAGGDDAANSIAIDDSLNVYVTGQSDNGSAGVKNNDFVTIKYNASGNQSWYAVYNGTGNNSDVSNVITVNGYDIYVTGGSWGSDSQKDIVVLKFPSTPLLTNEEQMDALQFLVYPNPSSDWVHIVYSGDSTTDELDLKLYSYSGQLILSKKFFRQQEFKMDISTIPSGLYFLSLNNEVFKKVIIQ